MRDVLVKSKAKMGKIPDNDLYISLANESDLSKKIDILSKKYPSIDNKMDKKSLEDSNFRNMYKELKSIDYFLKGLESDFFNLYFSKYEILFLQEIIESLVNKNFERNYINFSSNPLAKNFNLDPSMNLETFIEKNKNSRYYRTLVPYLNKNMEKDSVIFLSSNALMKFYYRILLKLAKKFPLKERKLIENFLGEEINLLNFEMLYRLKSYYNLNDSDIFNYLIEGGNTFNGQRLKELSLLSKEDFLKKMKSSKYKTLFDNNGRIHKEVRKRELKLYRGEITRQRSDILYVISAMNIIFISGENIESLLELDDSFTADERMEYLIVR
ncbi:V0D/AC39 family V-type ATPase subunit [Anaerococcus nagyae]|uniref:V0D/AC39 family V-type ATPase subunit n=1 Tax=Anaerococcus nagyae TaxID=1755241 RepID=UPI001AE5E3DF|nr:V-type ATPase subunit [Anaerococcus nagyae]MBP2069604.1 V/A-type H+-transporting ATPase subunit C [Anaerococcus nagyae]